MRGSQGSRLIPAGSTRGPDLIASPWSPGLWRTRSRSISSSRTPSAGKAAPPGAGGRSPRMHGPPADLRRQMLHAQLPLAPQDEGPLRHIAELADVPGPGIGLQPGFGVGVQGGHLPPHLAAESEQEVAQQRQDVLGPFPQRRQGNREDLQPVIQIRAELAGGQRFLQIPVGGRDDPHIHPEVPRSPRGGESSFPRSGGAAWPAGRAACRRSHPGRPCRRPPVRRAPSSGRGHR